VPVCVSQWQSHSIFATDLHRLKIHFIILQFLFFEFSNKKFVSVRLWQNIEISFTIIASISKED